MLQAEQKEKKEKIPAQMQRETRQCIQRMRYISDGHHWRDAFEQKKRKK